MIGPKIGKQSKMRGAWRKGNWHKHVLYGGAAATGVLLAHLTHRGESPAESYAHHFASTTEHGDRAASILRSDQRRDLGGPRTAAFYGHRYSHVLPSGAHQSAMRQGTQAQMNQSK